MSIDPETVFSLFVDVLLTIFSSALLFLVLWQDRHRRSNQYFALCMFLFSMFGIVSLPFRIAQYAELDPENMIHFLVLFYVLGMGMLIDFMLVFTEIAPRLRRRVRVVSVLITGMFTYLSLTHQVFDGYQPSSGGMYEYGVTPWGVIGVSLVIIVLGGISVGLYVTGQPKMRETAVPGMIVVIGAVLFLVVPVLRRISVNTITLGLTAFLLGRVVIKYQVFKPLADVNETLAQKNAELVYATQAKAQFLANMSHELRTPLNSIIGYTELVSEGTYGDLNERQRDRLQKVTRNGRLLLDLINGVLDLSKIEAGRVELDLQAVDTNALLDDLLQHFQPLADAKGLALVRAYISLPSLRVDPERTRQILTYVLANAVRFTEEGAVIMRGYVDVSRQQVVLSVTDSGPGIEPRHREHVFEAFQQADGVLARSHDGIGLGLAIAHRLTLLHGGNLWFETVMGEGTTFHIALPAAESVVAATPDRVALPRHWHSGPVILVIDDDPEAVELIQDQLEADAYLVYGAHSVSTGLQMVHSVFPSLIILDIALPDVDGWQMLEALRSSPATAGIPIVIISATDAAETARKVGAEGFILKPVQADELLAQVRQFVPHEAKKPALTTVQSPVHSETAP